MRGESEVPGGVLNLISTNYPDHGHHGRPPLSRKSAHGRAGNRTRDLMVSSQELWPSKPRGWSFSEVKDIDFSIFGYELFGRIYLFKVWVHKETLNVFADLLPFNGAATKLLFRSPKLNGRFFMPTHRNPEIFWTAYFLARWERLSERAPWNFLFCR